MFSRTDQEPAVLPFDIRYALQYRKAEFTCDDLETFFRSRLARFGFAMLMKAHADNNELQKQLLDKACERQGNIASLTIEDVSHELKDMPDPTVTGTKVATVMRHGLGAWLQRFDNRLNQSLTPDSELFMLANAPYIGFDVLYQHTLRQDRPLGILKPNRFDHAEQSVGFMLQPGEPSIAITELPHDFARPDDAVIFDDVIHTGKAQQKLLNFWMQQAESEPSFIASLHVTGH